MTGTVYALAAAINFAREHNLDDILDKIVGQVPRKSLAREYLLSYAAEIVKPFWSFDEYVVEEVKDIILSPVTLAAALLFFKEHQAEVDIQDIVGDNGTINQLFRYLGVDAEVKIHTIMGILPSGSEWEKGRNARNSLVKELPSSESLKKGAVAARDALDQVAKQIENLCSTI